MAFNAGAAVAQFLLDTTGYQKGKQIIQSGNKGLAKSAKSVGAAVAVVGSAVAAVMASSVVKANEFQKAFSNVNTLVDQTAVNTQDMAKELLVMDGRLGSATELTSGLYQALSASVEPAKAVKFVGEAAKFAGAALVSTNTAVDVITTGLNAYGLEADAATGISDKLFSVIKQGKTTGDELASTIGASIPLAANMGITFDELGASLVVMTRQGVSSAEATTQFNAAAQSFLKPSEGMQAALKKIGFESGSAAVEQLGLQGALKAVIGSTDGSKDSMAALLPSTRALRGAMALTGEGAKDFDQVLKNIEESAGTTQTAFDKQEKTFETLKNTAGNLQVVIGNVGSVFAKELAGGATDAAAGMIKFLVSGQGAEVVSNVIAGVNAGFQLFKKILTPIVDVIMVEGKEIFNAIGGALEDVGGGTAEAAGAFNILSYGVNIVTSVFKVMSTILQAAITNVGNLITAIRMSGGVIDNFFKFLSGKKKWGDVINQADAAAKAFAVFGEDLVDGYKDVFGTIVEEATGFQSAVKAGAKDMDVTVKSSFETTKKATKETYNELITGQKNLTDALTVGTESVLSVFEKAEIEKQKAVEETTAIALASIATRHQFEQTAYQQTAAIREAIAVRVSEEQTAFLEKQQQIIESHEATASAITSSVVPSLNAVGAALVNNFNIQQELKDLQRDAFETEEEFLLAQEEILGRQESVWDGVKKSALGAIASVVEGFAKQWALQSIAAFAVGNIGAGAGFAAASVAGFVAAGVIPALAEGGDFQGPALVGEEGPELIFSEQRSRVIPADETRNLLTGNQRPITINPTYIINNEVDIEMANRNLGRSIQGAIRSL